MIIWKHCKGRKVNERFALVYAASSAFADHHEETKIVKKEESQMNQFKAFQDALEEVFSSLTLFSDLNWNEIIREYIASHEKRPENLEEFVFNFPLFLQSKAMDGDCPPYLHELAFVELMQTQALSQEIEIPDVVGFHLNPTLSFLNLEFDINLMLDEAAKGGIQIIQRPHVLCIYRDPNEGLNHLDITTDYLVVLQKLEDGPLSETETLTSSELETLKKLQKLGLIIEISG